MSVTIVTPADEPLQLAPPELVPKPKKKDRTLNAFSCVTYGVHRLARAECADAVVSKEAITTMANMYVGISARLEARARIARGCRETMRVSDIKLAAEYLLPAEVYDTGVQIYAEALRKRKANEAQWKEELAEKRKEDPNYKWPKRFLASIVDEEEEQETLDKEEEDEAEKEALDEEPEEEEEEEADE
jgi:hypothetical protein